MPASYTISPKYINFTKDPIWIEIETDLITAGEATEPNLSCYIRIYKDGAFLNELNSAYDLNTAKTDFDLSGVVRLRPEAPADGSMSSFSQGVCDHNTCRLDIWMSDMFGDPVEIPTGFNKIEGVFVVYGHTPYWNGIGIPYVPSTTFYVLHSYMDMKGYTAVKEIRKSQPEYVYIFATAAGTCAMNVEIIYTDGTNDTASAGSVTMEEGKISWINVGWDARNMDAIADPTKTVHYYINKFSVGGSVVTSITYALDDHDTPEDEYIMYDNGIGGCEVVRCSGRHQIGVSVRKEYTANARSRGSNYRDGFSHAYNIAGAEKWEMQSGYYNKQYIRHLGQMFLAERVWYLDRERDKFISVTLRQNDVSLYDMDSDLHAISFTMEFDRRPAIGTLNI
jgi:hypothetical protein